MQEGDVQIKGYPVRLPLDVALVFTANPEDYTARGKIITPLKDRIGSEIRTHYPATLDEGIAITAQEAWMPARRRSKLDGAAVRARGDRAHRLRGARRQAHRQALRRQPAPAHHLPGKRDLQRRAARHPQPAKKRSCRASAISTPPCPPSPASWSSNTRARCRAPTRGARLIRTAVAKTFDHYFDGVDMQQIVQWFDLGGEIKMPDDGAPAEELLEALKRIQGLLEKLGRLGVKPKDAAGVAGFRGRVRAGRPVRAQAHRPQRGARLHRRRKAGRRREAGSVQPRGALRRPGRSTEAPV